MSSKNRTAILTTVGVAAIMLVIGLGLGSVVFPMTKTTTQLTTVTFGANTTTVTRSSYPNLVYAENLSGYFPNGYYTQSVNITNLKDGENITLGQVRFQFIVNQNNYVTTEGSQVATVTADYVCPSMFMAYFPDGRFLLFIFCPAPWLASYPKGSQWSVSNGTVPIAAVSIQSCLECEVEIAVGK